MISHAYKQYQNSEAQPILLNQPLDTISNPDYIWPPIANFHQSIISLIMTSVGNYRIDRPTAGGRTGKTLH